MLRHGFDGRLGHVAEGLAGYLVGFQLAQATVNRALQAGLVAGEVGEGVSAFAIQHDCAAGQGGLASGSGVLFYHGMNLLDFRISLGNYLEAIAEDGSFHGEGAVEAPLSGGDAADEYVFTVADGVEAVAEVLEEGEEFAGVFVKDEVLVGAETMGEAVAAGCSFALVAAGARRFLGVAAIGVDLGLGGGEAVLFIFHGCLRAVRPLPSACMVGGGRGELGG